MPGSPHGLACDPYGFEPSRGLDAHSADFVSRWNPKRSSHLNDTLPKAAKKPKLTDRNAESDPKKLSTAQTVAAIVQIPGMKEPADKIAILGQLNG